MSEDKFVKVFQKAHKALNINSDTGAYPTTSAYLLGKEEDKDPYTLASSVFRGGCYAGIHNHASRNVLLYRLPFIKESRMAGAEALYLDWLNWYANESHWKDEVVAADIVGVIVRPHSHSKYRMLSTISFRFWYETALYNSQELMPIVKGWREIGMTWPQIMWLALSVCRTGRVEKTDLFGFSTFKASAHSPLSSDGARDVTPWLTQEFDINESAVHYMTGKAISGTSSQAKKPAIHSSQWLKRWALSYEGRTTVTDARWGETVSGLTFDQMVAAGPIIVDAYLKEYNPRKTSLLGRITGKKDEEV